MSARTTSATSLLRSLTLSHTAATTRAISSAAATAILPTASAAIWSPRSRRTGVLAVKQGMTCLWDTDGIRVPVTVLHLDNVQVISANSYPSTSTTPAHHSVTVGCSPRRVKTTSSSMLGEFRKAGIEPKMRVGEFAVSADALPTPGDSISAAHFVPGQHVDVQAYPVGAGTMGTMKRYSYAGLRASHGVSVSHRSMGSTGQHQDPGRVWKGKAMPGRDSHKITTQNLLVHRIDLLHNIIYVHGAVPGPPGGYVRVTDALKKVQWKAGERARKGLNVEGEVLDGITGLPMPIGSDVLAKSLGYREVVAARRSTAV